MTQAYTQRFTEVHEPGGLLFPDTRAIGLYNTGWLSMRDHQRAVFLVAVGTIAAAGTVDFYLEQATSAAGAGATAIFHNAGLIAITQLTQAGGDGQDLLAVEIRSEQMDVNLGYAYIRGVLNIGGNTAQTTVIPLRGCSNYPPVPVTGWTEVITQ